MWGKGHMGALDRRGRKSFGDTVHAARCALRRGRRGALRDAARWRSEVLGAAARIQCRCATAPRGEVGLIGFSGSEVRRIAMSRIKVVPEGPQGQRWRWDRHVSATCCHLGLGHAAIPLALLDWVGAAPLGHMHQIARVKPPRRRTGRSPEHDPARPPSL